MSVLYLIMFFLGVLGLIAICLEISQITKLKKTKSLLELDIDELESNKQFLDLTAEDYETKIDKMRSTLRALTEESFNYTSEITKLKESYDAETAKLQEFIKGLNDTYDREAERLSFRLEEDRNSYKDAYLKSVEEIVKGFNEDSKSKKEEILQFQQELDRYKSLVDAAVEAKKREEEKESQQDFYRLQLSEQDIAEIKKLREASSNIRYPDAINKVIYKVYYEKPYNALIGRVIGDKDITGIYKITNILDGKCYVGQAVNIRERWRQHIKRGVGAETPTRNKLYPAMQEIGPENFTFEVIEKVKPEELNEREDYWQEYFHAKDFGYSIK